MRAKSATALTLGCLAIGALSAGSALGQPATLYSTGSNELVGRTGLSTIEVDRRLAANSVSSQALSALKTKGTNWLAGSWIDPESLTQYIATKAGTPKSTVDEAMASHGYEKAFVHVQAKSSLFDLGEAKEVTLATLQETGLAERIKPFALSLDEKRNTWNLLLDERLDKSIVDAVAYELAQNELPVSITLKPKADFELRAQACSVPHCDRPLRGAVSMGFRTTSGTSTGSHCSNGFFARSASGNRYVITAGHCFSGYFNTTVYGRAHAPSTASPYWPEIGKLINTLSSWGDGDYAAVRIESNSFWNPNTPGGYYQDWGWGYPTGNMFVYGANRLPQLGEEICRYGWVTHYSCGFVTSTSLSAPVDGVWVNDMFTASACSRKGDSGGTTVNRWDHALLGTLTGVVGAECPSVPGTVGNPGFTTAYYKASSVLGRTGLTLIR